MAGSVKASILTKHHNHPSDLIFQEYCSEPILYYSNSFDYDYAFQNNSRKDNQLSNLELYSAFTYQHNKLLADPDAETDLYLDNQDEKLSIKSVYFYSFFLFRKDERSPPFLLS